VRRHPRRGERPLGRAGSRSAALYLRARPALWRRRGPAHGLLDLTPRARPGGPDHHRGARDHGRAEPASPTGRAAGEGRARPPRREPVDPRGIVEEARETGELLAEEAGVQMEVTTPADPVVVSVDATRIRQLILNLLTNAVKYTPAGGSVRLQLGPANGKLT